MLKPIFTDLSSDELLKKCQHGKTQNANEGIHSILNYFNIDSGIFTKLSSAEKLKARVRGIIKKESEAVKRRRKQLRSMRKGYLDREKEEEGGESYVPGAY